MNVRSVSHNYEQTQPLWINDPFELKGTPKGLKLISNKRNLTEYAAELAYLHGKHYGSQYILSLIDLSGDEQSKLAMLYMEATDRDVSECVHGRDFSIENDYTCALLALLHKDCQETRDTFADVTRKNIIDYYANTLQGLLDEACDELLCNMKHEVGSYSYQDRDSGEILWSSL